MCRKMSSLPNAGLYIPQLFMTLINNHLLGQYLGQKKGNNLAITWKEILLIRSPAVRSRWESSISLPKRSALEMDVEPYIDNLKCQQKLQGCFTLMFHQVSFLNIKTTISLKTIDNYAHAHYS